MSEEKKFYFSIFGTLALEYRVGSGAPLTGAHRRALAPAGALGGFGAPKHHQFRVWPRVRWPRERGRGRGGLGSGGRPPEPPGPRRPSSKPPGQDAAECIGAHRRAVPEASGGRPLCWARPRRRWARLKWRRPGARREALAEAASRSRGGNSSRCCCRGTRCAAKDARVGSRRLARRGRQLRRQQQHS